MITYLRMSSAWHKGDDPARVPRSLAGDGEAAAGGHGLLDVPGHASGPGLAIVAGEHSCLVEENGSGFRAGVRRRVVARAPMCGSTIRHAASLPGPPGPGLPAPLSLQARGTC